MKEILTTVDEAKRQQSSPSDSHYTETNGSNFAIEFRSRDRVREELLNLISVARVPYSPGEVRVLHLRGDDKDSLRFINAMIEKGDVQGILENIGVYKIRLHIHNPSVSVMPLYVDIYRAGTPQEPAIVLSNNEDRGIRHSVYEKDFSAETLKKFVIEHYPREISDQLNIQLVGTSE